MKLYEIKQKIDRMLFELNRNVAIEPTGNNKIILKQASDALSEMDRLLASFNYLNKLTDTPD